jgi:hypothetical protein
MNSQHIDVEVDARGTVTVRRREPRALLARGRVGWTDPDARLIGLFERWLTLRDRTWSGAEIRTFGTLLHRCLFPQKVWPWVEVALDRDDVAVTHLSLAFPVEGMYARLAALPWEYLHTPERSDRGGRFLAQDGKLVLSRYIPSREGVGSVLPDAPVRVLAVVSGPDDPRLGPVEAGPVLDALRRLPPAEFAVSECIDPTADELVACLERTEPHLVHFMGHGRFDDTRGQGAIALPHPDGGSDWVEDRRLAQMLGHRQALPGVVVLHSCEGGRADFALSFAGLAPQLVRAGVRAVVAMQYPVTNATAVDFSTALYEQLAQRRPLDEAVQECRWRISGQRTDPDPRLLGVPVLYWQGDSPPARARVAGRRRPASDARFAVRIGDGKVEGRWEPGNRWFEDATAVDELALETVELLEAWLLRHWSQIATLGPSTLYPKTFRVLGTHLWNLVFDNRVGAELIAGRERASDDRPLRLLISFDGSDVGKRLADLPWEFLCYPGPPASYLATATELVLVRQIDSHEATLRSSDTLRVVFWTILPEKGFEDERTQSEATRVELATQHPGTLRVEPTVDGWKPEDVRAGLGGKADVVHVVGVCSGDRTSVQLLSGKDASGTDEWRNSADLVEVLTRDKANRPELVVLHLCDSASSTTTQNFERLAPALIAEGVPAVIAMQYPMAPGDAKSFITTFYENLVDGHDVGRAVQEGRWTMGHGARDRRFGTPVLYLQSTQGRLLTGGGSRRRKARTGKRATAAASVAPVPAATPGAAGRSVGTADVLDVLPALRDDAETAGELRRLATGDVKDREAVSKRVRMRLRDKSDDSAERLLYTKAARAVGEEL